MSFQITTAFVEQYKANLMHLSQQKGSRLRNAVRTEEVTGKNAYIERLGAATAVDATSRHDDTPQIDSEHTRRRLSLVTSRWADLIDNPDKVRMLINPESDYAMAGANALGRRLDDHIIDAASGNAFSGVAGGTTVALPAAQKIVHGSAGLTLAKLINAKEILDSNEVEPTDRFIAVTSDQLGDLLGDTTITSADYNTVKALVMGDLDTFMGFKFIHSERLDADATPSRLVLVWQKNAIRLGVGREPMVRITERSDKNYSTQVFVEMDMGATRVEDEAVVEIACNE